MRAALSWSRSERGDRQLGLLLAAAMRRYWDMRGLPSEAREQLTALLGQTAEPSAARLGALVELGGLATRREEFSTVERCAHEAAEIAGGVADARGTCQALELLSYAAFHRGDAAAARRLAARSQAAARRSGQPAALAHASMAGGVAAFGSGDLDAAVVHLTRALANARARADHWFIGECASVLALVHLVRRDWPAARAAEAESLASRVALRNRPGMALNLKMIGTADAGAGQHARAALLFGGAAAIEETTGDVLNRQWLGAYQQAVSQSRASLGSARFTELWRNGQAMREGDVVMIALLKWRAMGTAATGNGGSPHARPRSAS